MHDRHEELPEVEGSIQVTVLQARLTIQVSVLGGWGLCSLLAPVVQ